MAQFVIGIGSQRAGSTLLHRVLDECTDIFMHPVKELHYYDTLFGVRAPEVLTDFSQRQLFREVDRLIEAKAFGYVDKKYKCFLRANKLLSTLDVRDIEYMDLYRPCISGNQYFGEITPEYMILPEEGVAKLASDLGKETKIILISRNPTERFISAFKLLKNYNNPNYDSSLFSEDLESTLLDMPEWVAQQTELNDYESALKKYRKYFDSVLFLSLETIIDDPNSFATELEQFLGVAVNKERLGGVMGNKVNAMSETGNISDTTKAELDSMFSSYQVYLKKTFNI
ncbi:hypothetical protein EOL70_16810 [Leucothrix sargassi]|nr:hypothetical protein EOL70_16810 [Leucothrix sargassi]